MATTTAYREIGRYVDTYLFKKKLPQDDYFLYLQHACDAWSRLSRTHTNKVVTTKIAVSALGIIEMPTDMVGFSNLFVPIDGEWWSFTKKHRKVMTTTTTLNVEGQDADMGEGVDVKNNQYWGLGGKGGVNSYYMNIDWTARRIFCDGFKSDTAVLQYTSNGLQVGANTYIDSQCEPVLDAYIDWQRELIEPRGLGMISTLKGYYDEQLQKLKIFNFMPSRDEIADAWDSTSSQSVQR